VGKCDDWNEHVFPNTTVTGQKSDLTKAKDALTNHLESKVNLEVETLKFRKCKPEETVQSYYTHLILLAGTCSFGDEDREIKTQIIQFCSSGKLHCKALSDAYFYSPNL
jgi:hypothetical protein